MTGSRERRCAVAVSGLCSRGTFMLFKTSRQIGMALAGLVLMAAASFPQPASTLGGFVQIYRPGPAGGKVSGVEMRLLRMRAKGKCPTKLTFYCQIATDGPATVKYTWVTSDGKSRPVTSLTFSGKGLKQVSTTWEIGKPGQKFNGWIQLETISPNKVSSTKQPVSFQCE